MMDKIVAYLEPMNVVTRQMLEQDTTFFSKKSHGTKPFEIFNILRAFINFPQLKLTEIPIIV